MARDESEPLAGRLRLRAEAHLDALADTPSAEAEMHELRVHQIELEMQAEELRRAQRELQQSQEKYFGLFNSAPVGYVTLDDDGVVIDFNSLAVSLLRLDDSPLGGRPFSAFVLPADSHSYHLHLRKLRQTGESQSVDLRLQRRGGQDEYFWAHLESGTTSETADQSNTVRLAFTDITVQKLLELELRQSTERNALLIENMSEGLALHEIVLDETGRPVDYRFLQANPAFEMVTGLPAAEIIGKTALEAFPGTELMWIEKFGEVARTGVPAHIESFASALGGYYDVRAYSPGPGLFATVVADITLRTQAEHALRESEEKFRFIFDHSVVAKSITMPTGEVNVNQAFCDMLGYERDELSGPITWRQLSHPDDTALTQHYIDELLSGAREFARFEKRYIRKDGSTVWADLSTSIRRDADHQPLYFITTALDITSSKRDEVDLARGAERLSELLAERERHLDRLGRMLYSITEVVTRVVESRDPYTAGHERRVSSLAAAIAEEMGMSDEQTEEIRIAGLVHDVGKMSVPAEILSKPGRLSSAEFELIKCHPEVGSGILAAASMEATTVEMVLQHHERCDGSGYPRGLRGPGLLVGAKLLAVADVVEAMTSHRPYRASLGIEAALAEIEQGAGRLYDAGVCDACIRLFRVGGFEFPVAL